jgi:dihydroflavonol-4-reductase
MAQLSDQTVLVTGATGYIARHVVVQLIDAGYTVRGTARSAASAEALRDDLRPHVADPGAVDARFSVVAADLMSDDGWADAVSGCEFVHHVASPIPSVPPKDENELIAPAREGTLRVLRAAADAGVRRVVLTSSIAAVLYGVDRDKVFSAADWSNVDDKRIGAYEKSKTIAERAAWEFVRTSAPHLELTAINPGLVLGPLIGSAMSTSHEVVKKLLGREVPASPDLTYSMIDARDVAAAHVAAMTAPSAVGQRFLTGGPSTSMREVAQILHREFSLRGYRIPTRNLPSFLVRLIAKFDKTVALGLNDLARPQHIDNAPVIALIGRPLRDTTEMVAASAEGLIEHGHIKRRPRR